MKEVIKKIIVTILTKEAKCVLYRHKPCVIAITGNVGKTSTKDAIYEILSKHVSVRKTQKSYNSDFGIPLSILALPNAWGNMFGWISNMVMGLFECFNKNFPKYLVLEIGADHPGDISKPAKWIRPQYAVFTRLPEVPVHIEFFNNKEEVIAEKKSLAKHMRADGIMILNHDDPRVLEMKNQFPQKALTYGTTLEATLVLDSFRVEKKDGVLIGLGSLLYKNKAFSFSLPRIIAQSQILSALPGILILIQEGFSFEDAIFGLSRINPTNGRVSCIKGINDSMLIDDTYNSSPAAVENAIETLLIIPEVKRRIAVLGDMMELGSYAEEEHRKIGHYVAPKIDVLITIGSRSKFTHDEAMNTGVRLARWFETSEKAGEFIKDFIQEGDCVLFKGSQSVRVERALKMCVAEQSDIKKYLVRQEDEWLKK